MIATYHEQKNILLFQLPMQFLFIQIIIVCQFIESESAIPGYNDNYILYSFSRDIEGERFKLAMNVATYYYKIVLI